MKAKYTIYNQNKKSYSLFGWQGATRKQSNDTIQNIIAKHETFTWAVYKVKDNLTGCVIATNAQPR